MVRAAHYVYDNPQDKLIAAAVVFCGIKHVELSSIDNLFLTSYTLARGTCPPRLVIILHILQIVSGGV
jgi:hypothetical protein